MRQFIRECKECWVVTLFILFLFAANGLHLFFAAETHNFNLPMILRLLDVLR
jgi:hypothetical protein